MPGPEPKKCFGVDLKGTNYETLSEMNEKEIVDKLKIVKIFDGKDDEFIKTRVKKFLLADKIHNYYKNDNYKSKGAEWTNDGEDYRSLKNIPLLRGFGPALKRMIGEYESEKLIKDFEKVLKDTEKEDKETIEFLKRMEDEENILDDPEKKVLEEENNQKVNVEDANKNKAENNNPQTEKQTNPPVDQEKLNASLLSFGDQLNNTAAANQAVLSNMLLKNSTEVNETDKQVLTEYHKALEEKEADVRKYMPVKTDELNISVPDLIQDQMRLEAGQMSRDEKNQHFMNIIKMKGMDGDKYDKQLRDYGMKVAEEAGREFEKKHQDPAKLSFLNKSANAIETVMCAMSRNPLGILMLLAAAMYAPLMMVGLLAFTAWKRKRPNPAYQNAWQEQNRRELEQKREQLANLYNVDASSISDREVTKALKADYVNAKIIDAMDAKLERDSRKAVDSIAKDYAKSISKESGTKYSAKDLKDSAKKDLLWKDRYEENAATLLTNREDKMRKAIEHHENEKKKAMGRSL